ncbi:MAG: class I SAM-dependent methyltransferase, partial [Proteobacteria bacterium]|nr:class I SAM-dependent methyltransferase [Pseudomonadota bacterium]
RAHWEAAAKLTSDNDALRPTARDPYLQEVVEAAIEKWLTPEGRLLDIGCGDGQSTLRFGDKVYRALGVDYMAAFIDRALAFAGRENPAVCDFAVADVLDLSSVYASWGTFDIVVTIRCLINLASWENQASAIEQIARCVKPGGLYICSEGWIDRLASLNQRRVAANLEPLKAVDYNLFMDRAQFEAEVGKYFEIIATENLGFYLFISRVFQPCFVYPEQPSHAHDINRVAAKLQAHVPSGDEFSDCDYAGIYVLRRLPGNTER